MSRRVRNNSDRELGDQLHLARLDLFEMFGNDLSNRVTLRSLFKLTTNPVAFGSCKKSVHVRLTIFQWPIIEIRRVLHMPGVTIRIQFDV